MISLLKQPNKKYVFFFNDITRICIALHLMLLFALYASRSIYHIITYGFHPISCSSHQLRHTTSSIYIFSIHSCFFSSFFHLIAVYCVGKRKSHDDIECICLQNHRKSLIEKLSDNLNCGEKKMHLGL